MTCISSGVSDLPDRKRCSSSARDLGGNGPAGEEAFAQLKSSVDGGDADDAGKCSQVVLIAAAGREGLRSRRGYRLRRSCGWRPTKVRGASTPHCRADPADQLSAVWATSALLFQRSRSHLGRYRRVRNGLLCNRHNASRDTVFLADREQAASVDQLKWLAVGELIAARPVSAGGDQDAALGAFMLHGAV
jgi:hypothetical protein